jgi:hypothetical protein
MLHEPLRDDVMSSGELLQRSFDGWLALWHGFIEGGRTVWA